jgi:hypothetical protein
LKEEADLFICLIKFGKYLPLLADGKARDGNNINLRIPIFR